MSLIIKKIIKVNAIHKNRKPENVEYLIRVGYKTNSS